MVFWCCVSTGQENPAQCSFVLSSRFPVWVNLWVGPVTSTLLTNKKLRKAEETPQNLTVSAGPCVSLTKKMRQGNLVPQRI